LAPSSITSSPFGETELIIHFFLASNFGTFHIRFKKSRVGRNPKTKEEKIIKERNVVLFKPSKDFKNFINNNNEKKLKSL